MRCAVASCNTDNQAKHYNKDVKLFRFPKNVTIREVWFKACRRKDKFNINNARICSKHFEEKCFERNLRYELQGYSSKSLRQLKPDAVPILHLKKISVQGSEDNGTQLGKRKCKKIVDDDIIPLLNSDVEIIAEELPEENADRFVSAKPIPSRNKSIGVNTEYNVDEDQLLIISRLKGEISRLKEEKEAFENIFTAQQIKKLREPKKRPRWTAEDISKAIAIHSAGPRAYQLLLEMGFPFPAVSTLRAS